VTSITASASPELTVADVIHVTALQTAGTVYGEGTSIDMPVCYPHPFSKLKPRKSEDMP